MERTAGGITYTLTRRRVRNINLRVRADGSVAASASPRVPAAYVDAFVTARADWVRTAQARAATYWVPEADTVFEIGGQDSKYISLKNGEVADFQMNKICAAGTGSFVEEQAASVFADVPADAYYAKAVEWAVKKGITNGKSNGLFGSNDPCTRGQIVTFLWRAAGSPQTNSVDNPFTDVKRSDYYYQAVLWAVANNVTNGVSATSFDPNVTVQRDQVVTFLWRASGKPAAKADLAFSDLADGAFYADAVQWAVAHGITTGTSSTTFAPADGCTRAQIVTFLYRSKN